MVPRGVPGLAGEADFDDVFLPFFHGRRDGTARAHADAEPGPTDDEAGDRYVAEDAFTPDATRTALARRAAERTGAVTDIACCEPYDGPPEQPAPHTGAFENPVTGIVAPARLDRTCTPGPAQSDHLDSLAQRRIAGERCPSCRKVHVPPRGACPTAGPVEVGPRGAVTTCRVVDHGTQPRHRSALRPRAHRPRRRRPRPARVEPPER